MALALNNQQRKKANPGQKIRSSVNKQEKNNLPSVGFRCSGGPPSKNKRKRKDRQILKLCKRKKQNKKQQQKKKSTK